MSGSKDSINVPQVRRLIKPEEILNMIDGLELLFVKGYPANQAGKIRYF